MTPCTGHSYFKHLVVEKGIKLLIEKSNIVNRKTNHVLDSFFITVCQLEPEIDLSDIINTPSCSQKIHT